MARNERAGMGAIDWRAALLAALGLLAAALPAGQSRTFTAAELESGNAPGLSGALGDGAGNTIAQLAQALGVVDRGYVYDNSVDGELPALLFRTVDGHLAKTYREDHEWAMDVRASDWGVPPKGARSQSKSPAP